MKDDSKITDEELVQRYRNGDEQAQDLLLERHKGLVRKKANALFLIGADKDDLNQEGMIGLLKALREYDPDKNDSFTAFASLCITRQMYTAIESAGRKKNDPLNSYLSLTAGEENEEGRELFFDKSDPETIYIDRESTRLLKEKIGKALSPLERQVLKLHLEGKGYQQIAEELSRSPKSVDNALQRLKNKITEIVEEG